MRMGLREVNRGIEGLDKYKQVAPFAVIVAVIVVGILVFFALQPGGETPSGALIAANETSNQTANETETNETEEDIPNRMKPDFKVTEITFSEEEIFVEREVTISATIENVGVGNASSVQVEISVGDDLTYSDEIPLLEAGASETVTATWTPTSLDLGEKSIRVDVDPENLIDEKNDRNNEETITITVEKVTIKEITVKEYKKSFDESWFSDFQSSPPSIEDSITYFMVSKEEEDKYLLDVGVAGIRTKRTVSSYELQIPLETDSGWSRSTCIKETLASDRCVWNGPQIVLKLSIDRDKNRLKAQDLQGEAEFARVEEGTRRIKKITFIGAQKADFPREINIFRIMGSPTVDGFVPESFYEIKDNAVYFMPFRWNPTTLQGEIYMRAQFLVEVS